MRPFLQLRRWWARAPYSSKAGTLVAVAVVLGLVAWAAAPTGGARRSTSALSTGGPALAGAAADAQRAGRTETAAPAIGGGQPPAVTAGSSTANSGSGTSPLDEGASSADNGSSEAVGAGCLRTPAGIQAATNKTITIGFGYANLAGPIGNSAVGLASPDEFRRMAQAVVADINARGGVQCRTVALKFYEGNPLSADQTHATCLQAGQDRPLLLADAGAFVYPNGAYGCVAQQKIPIITPSIIVPSEVSSFSPYLASVAANTSTAMRDVAFGLTQRGFFDPAKGFKKLGLLYDQCSTEVNHLLDTSLAAAGITSGQTSRYVFACPPTGFASPTDMSQAVAQFKLAGVTHVIPLTGGGSFSTSFTNVAQGQAFHPIYAVTDYQGIIITTESAMKPNPANFDGGLAITTGTYGMNTTPGFPVDAGTRRCQAILTKAGFSADAVFGMTGGNVCSVLWVAEAAMRHARSLSPDALLPGLFEAGTVQLAYSNPDTTYRAPSKYYAGDTWAELRWLRSCSCWHNLDANRIASFAP